MHMIETQQNMEENELMFALALEQNEGAEKLRKVRKLPDPYIYIVERVGASHSVKF